jgi:hypothetical protein
MMIKLAVLIDKKTGACEATMEGMSEGKEELYILIGMMETLKAKLTHALKDEGEQFFAIDKKHKGDL